ncbi:MAG: isoleucine--tRNA ligase [Deltaproteobacteria bacterium]|nr:isoleucine--tRNA ligase [Deltaproteobacteria bacterium]
MSRHPTPPNAAGLPQSEEEVLAFWQEHSVFEKTLSKPAPNGSFVFFEGPPTANNVPHVGHALTRAIKDVVPRFRTMRGFRVDRKAGWDTHGLPVEISIEKELGFTDKHAVEQYGIEAFNEKCFQSVRRYERDWVHASERLGFWLDYDNAYFTFLNTYVESVWWILNRMFDEDMLYEGHKVLPYCPLCGTTHSSHEVAQAYKDVADPSVTIAFEVLPGQSRGDVDFDGVYVTAWTTTPWTLPSNMATCVHPEFTYKLVESKAHPGRRYLLAEGLQSPALERVGKETFDLGAAPALATFTGKELEGLQYEPLFGFSGTGTDAEEDRGANWQITADPYVTLDSGTGIVHVAPAFGEDDHRVGNRYGLDLYCAMKLDGKFKDHAGALAGLWFKDADPIVTRDLKDRGQLVFSTKYEHPYPHCWRHNTPLYYFATSSWFVRTTAMKDELIAGNQTVDWNPAHIKDGRFGKWLDGVVDWALSRKRYWGTPLPIWRCDECGDIECFGSFESLFARAGKPLPGDPYDREQWNPHRPYVDDISFSCSACDGGTKNRVVEVIDCWFDAGSMPFAQHHYPFNKEMAERIDSGDAFPADFISEAVDQTRGWFYTLHVISTFLKKRPAYKSVIVLGHVLDEDGRKMSKSIGNVVAPGPIIDQFGADAFRWFFYRANPTQPSRFGPAMVRDSLKLFTIPLLNAWQFFSIYAGIDGFTPAGEGATPRPQVAERADLDRWVLSLLQQTVGEVTAALEGNRLNVAANALESFVESLTNWYIRRSRRRFWKAEGDTDKHAAHWTLYEVLVSLSQLLAPFMPFLAERMHQDLVRGFDASAPVSVHLTDWPSVDADAIDSVVLVRQAAARQLVTLGHAARQEAAIGVRQPLAAATVVSVDDELLAALSHEGTAAIVRDELNVKELRFAEDRAAYVDYTVKPNFRALGKRLGKRMKLCAQAVGQMAPNDLLAALEADGKAVVVPSDGEPIELEAHELDIRIQQKPGTVSAFDEQALVALDTEVDDALAAEGLAREVINRIQGLRKDRDLAYDDRIAVQWDAGQEVAAALAKHQQLVMDEVLAVDMQRVDGLSGAVSADLRGESFTADLVVSQ